MGGDRGRRHANPTDLPIQGGASMQELSTCMKLQHSPFRRLPGGSWIDLSFWQHEAADDLSPNLFQVVTRYADFVQPVR